MRGLVRTVLTTNFDTCLPEALRERQPHIRHINEVNRYVGDYDQFNIYSKCQIIWLHGRAEHQSTIMATTMERPNWAKSLAFQ